MDHVRPTVYFEQRLSVLPVGRKSICPVLGAVKGRLVTEVFANRAATQCQRRHCHYRRLTLAGSLTDGQPQSGAQSSPSPRHPRLLLCPSKPCRILRSTTRTPNGLSSSHLLHLPHSKPSLTNSSLARNALTSTMTNTLVAPRFLALSAAGLSLLPAAHVV